MSDKQPKKRARRTKLVPRGGVECFEIRLVQYIDPDTAKLETGWEITPPDVDLPMPAVVECLGLLEDGKEKIRQAYRDDEAEDEE